MSIRVALVGYGAQFGMGKHHANHVRETNGLELVSAFDTDPIRRAAARDEQGVEVHESYKALLADSEIDLVVLITPHDTHAPLSIAASRAGKHVITEKVMCLNTREADEMIAASEDAGKMLTVYQNRRWDGDYLTVKREIDTGNLGKVFSIESSVNGWWFPGGWRGVKAQGGGMLYDWGAHLADQLVQLMLPAKPKAVFAANWHGVHEVDIETQTTMMITFGNGVMAGIDVGCISHQMRPRWLVRGEKAGLRMPDWNTAAVRAGETETPVQVEESRWSDFYQNVSNHLLNGAELEVRPKEVRIGIAILEAASISADTGRSVDLEGML